MQTNSKLFPSNDPANGMRELIYQAVAEGCNVKMKFFNDNAVQIVNVAHRIAAALARHNKVLLFGNGGSAADAQHIAAEFVGRYLKNRIPLAAIALTTDSSILTAVGNDFGYDDVFLRQVLALASPADILIGISTSGNSPNVIKALSCSDAVFKIGFTGEDGGEMNRVTDVLFKVPSRVTSRIQETHIMLGHILCDLVDRKLFPELY
jgi:D-sedoheptulose 7-phosphate isomerase